MHLTAAGDIHGLNPEKLNKAKFVTCQDKESNFTYKVKFNVKEEDKPSFSKLMHNSLKYICVISTGPKSAHATVNISVDEEAGNVVLLNSWGSKKKNLTV